jgi:hypothetical protein
LQYIIPNFGEDAALSSATEFAVPSVNLKAHDSLGSFVFVVLEIPQVGVVGPLTEKLWLFLLII